MTIKSGDAVIVNSDLPIVSWIDTPPEKSLVPVCRGLLGIALIPTDDELGWIVDFRLFGEAIVPRNNLSKAREFRGTRG
jgi:hypothetical protein